MSVQEWHAPMWLYVFSTVHLMAGSTELTCSKNVSFRNFLSLELQRCHLHTLSTITAVYYCPDGFWLKSVP